MPKNWVRDKQQVVLARTWYWETGSDIGSHFSRARINLQLWK